MTWKTRPDAGLGGVKTIRKEDFTIYLTLAF